MSETQNEAEKEDLLSTEAGLLLKVRVILQNSNNPDAHKRRDPPSE